MSELTVQRVRHPIKIRMLQVARVARLSPYMARVTLAGPDLAGFVSASFDDHIKLFFPATPQARPVVPQVGPDGLVFPEGPRPVARDYTPRRYDAQAGELDVDFVLHGTGPACEWAAQARPGLWLGVGGPRGSFVIPDGFDWHVLLGDSSALPAIARRLEELPAGRRAIVRIEVETAEAELPLATQADLDLRWLHRDADGPDALARAAQALQLPPGDGYVWVAAESAVSRQVRQAMVDGHAIPKSRIRAASYWKRGAAAVHEVHED